MTFHCVALHSKAGADQISDEPCLRLATLRFAFARPCSSKQRLRCPYQSIAVACRGFASPLPRVALLCVTVAVRCRSWPSYPMPLRIGSLPVLRGAVRFLAHPSPIAPMLCRRLRAALPCSSLAALDIAMPILRRSRLSRAFPSRRRAKQISSFAALGLAGLLRRRAARRCAFPFRRLPEQIKALPLQRPSPQRHRDARPSHANPLPPTSSLFRRTAAQCHANPSPHNASHGTSVAHHRNAPLSRRYSGSEPSVHSKRPLPLLRHWPMPRNCP